MCVACCEKHGTTPAADPCFGFVSARACGACGLRGGLWGTSAKKKAAPGVAGRGFELLSGLFSCAPAVAGTARGGLGGGSVLLGGGCRLGGGRGRQSGRVLVVVVLG